MKKILPGLLVVLAALIAWPSQAQVQLRDNYPSSYTVKRGDTLWDISGMYLRDPWLWPEIWQVNPQINNPHLIYPGDLLTLVYVDGKPRLVLNRGTMKLSPNMRTSPLGSAISAIPADVLNGFLSRSRVLDKETLELAPYVVAGSDHRLVSGAGDRIYGRGDFDPATRFYGIYRPGQVFRDPVTREKLGMQAHEIGTGQIIAEDDQVATVVLNYSNEEVRNSDRFLPMANEEVPSTFYPKPPESDINGHIIAVEAGVANVGRFDVVTINRGEREGLQVGDVLGVDRAGELVKDPVKRGSVQLPSERAGLMMVFKVFEKVSYGLILEAERPLSVMDEVSNP
ncbi:MAG: LysM peptidoglycan-binding domain-containing protein [Gammaproteobacteria bacterium]|nr:LysM peptidoglycan-binding domain-containing protein [Gammaproteobacteria bacterium]NND40256.1 LysM peptidoglycan-binding domain-containing protein [Pseudomonadales bacterium]MBT8150142.1 LysM peptidoglycan-binding domain-containing protein [Gammaproteobacteria bacterium]NNL10974.1 LysM peptidoglycan-binding domain-containing protein [Pseudomonadales bacterium]NNM11241.1 LysM peptidoglycan-binding domain-containing protein [Pseudomonadales bacterium]